MLFSDLHIGFDIRDSHFHHGYDLHPCVLQPTSLSSNSSLYQLYSARYMQFKDFIWSNLKLPLQRRVADEGHSKLYITFIQRNNTAGRGRSIVNIDAVYEATRELLPNSTIHITDLSSIPFSEQLELFAKTDVLVAVGGTALHNSLFMHPGTSILAIMPTAWCDWAW